MMKIRSQLFTVPIGIALIALLALPMSVLGNTSGPIAQTGGMTVELPLLNSSLKVVVTLDGVGNVSLVSLDPVGTGTEAYAATKLGPHAVTFTRADGATQVSIKAKGDKLSVKATAGTLAALRGSGTWSANVFPAKPATVGYTVGAAADGSPTVAINSVVAAGVTVVQEPPKTETEDHEASASVKIAFSLNGYTKKLSISVSVDTEGTHKASLKITLSGKDKQKLSGSLAEIGLGLHTWSGKLCDGSPVSIAYNVLDNGTVAYTSATGGTVTVKSSENGFSARFDGTKAKVKVQLKKAENGTTYRLKVEARIGECHETKAPTPEVNTPVAPGADKADDHDKKPDPSDDAHDGDDEGGHDGGQDGH